MTVDLTRALAVLAEPPTAAAAGVAEGLGLPAPSGDAYATVFLMEVYPYGSVYLGPEGMLGGEARDRTTGVWQALGIEPPSEPDHVAALLGILAALAERSHDARAAHARRVLLWEHVLPWMPICLTKIQELGVAPYDAWAAQTLALLAHEAATVPAPDHLPPALAGAPTLRNHPDTLVADLLAPIRSGVVLTRADLSAAARALGLGLRRGERRFILQALLDQDAPSTWAWIAQDARRWVDRYEALRGTLGPLTDFWVARARATADAITETTAPLEDMHAGHATDTAH